MKTTFDVQRERLTQEYREIPSVKTIGAHERYMVNYTQEWVDPAQQLIEQARTRKRLAIEAMRQETKRLQEQIAILKAELGE